MRLSAASGVMCAGFLALCMLCLANAVRAEEATQDFQTWLQTQAKVDLDSIRKGLSATLENTVRRGSVALVDKTTGLRGEAPVTIYLLRPSVSYGALPWLHLTLGYGWTPVYYDDKALWGAYQVNEHRVWEEITLSHKVKRLGLASRTRMEQRMRTSGPGAGDTEVRLRQRLAGSYTFKDSLPFQGILSNEVLLPLNTTDFPSRPGFGENRLFVGFAYRSSGIGLEIGYLNQYIGGLANPPRSNHVLNTSITFQFKTHSHES